MKTTTHIDTIKSIVQSPTIQGFPGNYVINSTLKKAKSENWFNSRDIRNSMLSLSLNPKIPHVLLVGARIHYTRLEITEQDIKDNPDGVPVQTEDRRGPIIFKNIGFYNINAKLDVLDMSPKSILKLVAKHFKVDKSIKLLRPSNRDR